MRSLIPSLAGLALAAAVLLLLASCGDGGDEQAAGIIHRLLLAASSDDSGLLESFPGELPDDLRADVPLYPGADLIVSNRQPSQPSALEGAPGEEPSEAPQPVLYLIVLDTAAARDDVFAFYEDALNEDPWQLEGSFSTEQLDTIQFVNVDDLDIGGAVSIASDEGPRTSILISLQDAGAVAGEEAPFEVGRAVPVPAEFPPDVPLYQGATVTGSGFFRDPGMFTFLVVFLTLDSQDAVIDFYRDAFGDRDWDVTSGESLALEDRIDFEDAAGDIQGELVADRFADAQGYTEVTIQVQLNPAREPVEGGDEAGPPPDGGAPAPSDGIS